MHRIGQQRVNQPDNRMCKGFNPPHRQGIVIHLAGAKAFENVVDRQGVAVETVNRRLDIGFGSQPPCQCNVHRHHRTALVHRDHVIGIGDGHRQLAAVGIEADGEHVVTLRQRFGNQLDGRVIGHHVTKLDGFGSAGRGHDGSQVIHGQHAQTDQDVAEGAAALFALRPGNFCLILRNQAAALEFKVERRGVVDVQLGVHRAALNAARRVRALVSSNPAAFPCASPRAVS